MRLLTRAEAREVAGWTYEAPYELYNHPQAEWPTVARELVADGYRVVDTDSVGLVACVGLGPDGRVRGGDYSVNAPSTVDIGLALRPDLTGQGRGRALVAQVAGFALSQHPGLDQRVTIAAFNSRAIRVWTQAGFVEESCFVRDGDRLAFAILRWVPED